jgi:hypothetical protein
MVYSSTTSSTSVSSTTKVATGLTGTITPTSAVNPVRVAAYGSTTAPNNSTVPVVQIYRSTGTTAIGNQSVAQSQSTAVIAVPTVNFVLDNPQSTNPTQYGVYIVLNTGVTTCTFLPGTFTNLASLTGVMTIEEIMG